MDEIKIKTIQANTVEHFDKQVLDLIKEGYANAGDLVVVCTKLIGNMTQPQFSFFQTFIWYPAQELEVLDEGIEPGDKIKEVKVTKRS